LLLPLIISVIVFYLFFDNISLSDIFYNIVAIPIEIFLTYALLTIIGTILRAYRYFILLSKQVSFFDLFLITLIRNFSVDLLPGRSASLAFYTILLKKKDISFARGSSSFILSVFYDGLALVIMLSILLLFIADNLWSGVYISMLIILLISIITVFFSENIIKIIINIKFIKKTKKIYDFLNEINNYLNLHKNNNERIIIFILSLLIRIVKYLFIFVLFIGIMKIGFELNVFSKFSFALAGTELSSLIPIQGLGGFGTWELAFKVLFESLNVMGNNTNNSLIGLAQAGIIIHIVSQVWEYGIGIIALIIYISRINLQNK